MSKIDVWRNQYRECEAENIRLRRELAALSADYGNLVAEHSREVGEWRARADQGAAEIAQLRQERDELSRDYHELQRTATVLVAESGAAEAQSISALINWTPSSSAIPDPDRVRRRRKEQRPLMAAISWTDIPSSTTTLRYL